jgi:hypothetical protein
MLQLSCQIFFVFCIPPMVNDVLYDLVLVLVEHLWLWLMMFLHLIFVNVYISPIYLYFSYILYLLMFTFPPIYYPCSAGGVYVTDCTCVLSISFRYFIALHTTNYQHPMLFLNTLAVTVLVVAKLPNMHKVRIFGINAGN